MDDVISRQMAIDVVEESRRLNHHQDGKTACAHEYEHRHFLKILRDLPPAQPERKTGTWIAVDYFADGKPAYREWVCSACGCVVEDEKPTGNFCKMCGADMRGKQDDEQASTNND